MDDDQLVREAETARARAYAPYSGYRVGAALLASDGRVHLGVNVENAAYPAGFCAERAALAAAVTGGRRRFVALAVAVEGSVPGAPCGLCRQALAEFGTDLRVVMAPAAGRRQTAMLAELLPLPFGPANLDRP